MPGPVVVSWEQRPVLLSKLQDHDLFPLAGRLSPEQVYSLVEQVASGLDYLHRHRVVHRDLKLENIGYVDRKQRIALFDFGFLCPFGEKGVKGTYSSMPPEIGTPVTGANDMWAMGILIYQLLKCDQHPLWDHVWTVTDVKRKDIGGADLSSKEHERLLVNTLLSCIKALRTDEALRRVFYEKVAAVEVEPKNAQTLALKYVMTQCLQVSPILRMDAPTACRFLRI